MTVARLALAAILAWTLLPAAEPAALDQWYVGDLNGQPAISLHLVSTPVDGGGRSTLAEMAVVLRRPMDKQSFRIEIRQRQELAEDAQGRITGFRIDNDENGTRTAATGRVEKDRVIAEVHHLGRIDKQELPLAEGTELLGQLASQERMAKAVAAAVAGAQPEVSFAGLELLRGQIEIVRSQARFVGPDAGGNFVFNVSASYLPGIQTSTVLDPRGALVSMGLDLVLFKVEVKRAPGPVALLGSEVEAAGMVALKGPTPQGGAIERYRLPPGATALGGDFQSVDGDVVTVRSEAPPEALPDPARFLAREAQLETDDPELRAWVAGVIAGHDDLAERAEALRVAVRGRITVRDLSVADGSALEAFRGQRGDCSEHANLLCAALRIAGIPARVDVGLICVPAGAADHPASWGAHAWVSAWVGGRWTHLDAAYPSMPRSRYIRLAAGSGGTAAGTSGAMVAAFASLMGREIESLPPAP